MKIRSKMILAVTLVVVLVGMITSGMWYYNSVTTINHYLKDYSDSTMKNTYESIKTVTDNVNYTEVMISNNVDNMVEPLKYNQIYGRDKEREYEVLLNERKIDEFIRSVYGYKDYLSGIIVYPREYSGKAYKVGAMTESEQALYEKIRALDEDSMKQRAVMMFPESVNRNSYSSMTFLIPMVKCITDTSGNVHGYIAAMFDYQILDEIVKSSMPEGGKLQIVDTTTGKLVYSNCGETELEQPGQNVFKLVKEKAAYNEMEFSQTGWVCKMQIPADALIGQVNQTIVFILFIYLIILAAAIGLVVYICYRLTRNILRLNSAMQKVATGDLQVRVQISSRDEIGDMAEVFNNMIVQLQELIQEVKKTEEQKRQTELHFLQAQINPHFLSNILNTVTWMANLQNEENIAKLTSSLVELLHSAMRKGKEIITVQDELHYIQSYIEIEQYCYVDNFEVIYDIEEGAEKLYIPRFLLQPIVENALIHSLNELTDRFGELKITVKTQGTKLLIITRDNGKGMTEEQIEYVLHSRKERNSKEFSSIGVYNVLERIQLMYGNEEGYGVQFKSEPGKFTEVTLTLPVCVEET